MQIQVNTSDFRYSFSQYSMINARHYFLINLVISAQTHFWTSTKISCVATISCNNSSSVKRFAKNCMVSLKLRQIGNLNFCDPHQIWCKNVQQDYDYSILVHFCNISIIQDCKELHGYLYNSDKLTIWIFLQQEYNNSTRGWLSYFSSVLNSFLQDVSVVNPVY